jgi:hypothetical protein
MLLDELTPAEQEALSEVEAAERELELARLRFVAVTSQRRAPRRRLWIVPPEGEPCDARH